MFEFKPYPKTPRFFREVVITEKIDGTNGQILINENGELAAASKNRILTLENDNAGFYRWCLDNKEELLKLGPGHHAGEWWGKGIQRGYSKPNKAFSLFNVGRWNTENIPNCVNVVPTLYQGMLEPNTVHKCLHLLRKEGSFAAPGFMEPEGVVIYHTAAKIQFKVMLENDDKAKGE